MSTPSSILMIRPVMFGYNTQTATTNAFQNKADQTAFREIQRAALDEFNNMTSELINNNIDILVVNDTVKPHTPDSIFPNNWISFQNETLILYAMLAENRRQERRQDIIDRIKKNFKTEKQIDLSEHEAKNVFLEGTGSIVFDYQNNYAFACISPRTDKHLTEQLCKQIGFTPVLFNSTDKNGQAIYHTNVMMCMAEEFCVICLESITSEYERNLVIKTISDSGKTIIDITQDQLEHFAGNMYELVNSKKESLLLMSEQAYKSLSLDQIKTIEQFCKPLPIPLYTIEKYGGGSARCMIADIRLEKIK